MNLVKNTSGESKKHNPILFFTIAPPGAGKSLFRDYFCGQNEIKTVISSDKIREEIAGNESNMSLDERVWGVIRRRVDASLTCGEQMFFDATSYCEKNRKFLYTSAENHKAKCVAFYIDTPIELCKQRNSRRERVVPEFVIDSMFEKLEVPYLSTKLTSVVRVRGSNFDEKDCLCEIYRKGGGVKVAQLTYKDLYKECIND